MTVAFHSRQLLEVFAAANPVNTLLVGREIFKLLADTAIALPKTFKMDVKRCLSSGQAISATIRLPMPRVSAVERVVEEKFVTHWTPLKNERGDVSYAVMTLSL